MKKSLLAIVLLSPSLLAHKEVVREIAQDISRSDYKSAKAHLIRLNRFNLSQEDHKKILKNLKVNAKTVRKNQEDNVKISTSWIDSLSTIGGALVAWYGLTHVPCYTWDDDEGETINSLSSIRNVLLIPVGAYAAYKGYKCWYQERCIKAAKKIEEYVEDALDVVKEG